MGSGFMGGKFFFERRLLTSSESPTSVGGGKCPFCKVGEPRTATFDSFFQGEYLLWCWDCKTFNGG
jgi:hypothetical protein